MSLFSSVKKHPLPWIFSTLALLLAVAVAVLFVLFFSPQVQHITLDQSQLIFHSLTQTSQLTPTVTPQGVAPRFLVWSSSDESVVTVSETGLVTPVGNGEAVITVKGKKGPGFATCAVRVSVLSSILFRQQDVIMGVGRSRQLQYSFVPQEAQITGLTWSSSDPSVVSVDALGVITSHKTGTVTVTATAPGGVSGSCTVRVTENVPVTGLSFAITEFTFDSPDDTLVLTPVFTPEDTSEREVQWISSDPSVCTVNPETGEVTPLTNGTATVMAQSLFGDFTASCNITVNLNIPLKGLSLSVGGYTFKGLKQTYLIRPSFDPVNASNQKITWTSSDPAVCTVSDQGLITSLKKGTAIVKLVTEDGGFTAEFTVTVAPNERVDVTGISLESFTATLEKGKTVKISASVKPVNATEKGITYTTKNPAVATVNSVGTVTAVGYGTTQIVVTSVEGGYSENFTVTVPAPVVPPPDTPTDGPTVQADYVKGVWVATVANINFPSKAGLSADQLKKEIDTIMDNTVQMGLNTVYFQVRPSGDALYPSDYYPTSAYVVKKQGDPLPLDILAYAIESAHDRGLSFHAWINPYRVTSSTTSTSGLASSNPAIKNPGWVVTNGKKLFLNPGLPEVRQYITDGVMEIVNKYNVDGIHFDDYFYPSELGNWDDAAAYKKYGNGKTLADWRRSNNDALVKGVYEAIKAKNPKIQFGISPAGVWAKKSTSLPEGTTGIGATTETYYTAFADTRKWVKEGWLDYICPQVYWEISHKAAPFQPIVDWWNDTVAGTGVDLYIGIAAYKCEDISAYKTGKEINAQLDYLDTKANVSGAVYYSYGSLIDNWAGVGDDVKERYYTPPISTALHFSQPSMTLDSSFTKTYIVGISDPNFPLYANGEKVARTVEGYFAYAATLTGTKTTVTFSHKGKSVDYVITRTPPTTTTSKYMSAFGFVRGSFTPAYDTGDQSGTSITFSCIAPAGSEVTVKIGSYTLPLTTKTKDPGDGKYLKATYTGTFTLPQTDGNQNQTLGYVVFHATRGEESATHSPGCLLEVLNRPTTMEVVGDKCDILPNLEVKPTYYYVATQGARVNVLSKVDGKAKLTNGMYMNVVDLKSVESPLIPAQITKSSMAVTQKNTVFSFQMTEAAFHSLWMDADYAELTLYNVTGEVPSLTMEENPLFSGLKAEKIDETTLRILLTYKASCHIYGYTCYFEGNTLKVAFRNPVTLADGDKPLTGVLISLDPGHCTDLDPGAIRYYNGKEIYESTLNMNLAKLVKARLEAKGATVILSHTEEETSYSLDETIAGFRELNPDLNLSIHFNAVDNDSPNATGTEDYWCYGNSQLFSDVLLKTFTDATGFKYRKSERDYYKVSRLCEFPSVLLETAFISNTKDLAWFIKDANMEKAADAIADGIMNFFLEQNN